MSEPMLNLHVVPTREFQKFIRSIYLNKTCISFTIVIWLVTTILAPGDRFQDYGLVPRALFNAASAFSYIFIGYQFYSPFVRFLLVRNIPFIWASVGFYSILALIEALIYSRLSVVNPLGLGVIIYWLTTSLLIFLTVAFLMQYFQAAILKNLSVWELPIPLWWPLRLGGCKLAAHLDADTRSEVLLIEAQNQYIRVTCTSGVAMLRMGFSKAMELVEADVGLQVHRSIWIRKSQIDRLVSRNGNPRLIDKSGAEIPISRSSVSDVKKFLSGL